MALHILYGCNQCQKQQEYQSVPLQFPVGRTRLETVAVIVCAVIMSIATVLVIRESIGALVDGVAHSELSDTQMVIPAFTSGLVELAMLLPIAKAHCCQSNSKHYPDMPVKKVLAHGSI